MFTPCGFQCEADSLSIRKTAWPIITKLGSVLSNVETLCFLWVKFRNAGDFSVSLTIVDLSGRGNGNLLWMDSIRLLLKQSFPAVNFNLPHLGELCGLRDVYYGIMKL